MKKAILICLCFLVLLGMAGCSSTSEYVYDPTENFTDIEWPDSDLAKRLPSPELTYGEIKYEQADTFCIYFGNVSREKYDNYVKECKDAGFVVDYQKSNTVYWAYDVDGYYVYLSYDEEHTMMSIEIRMPKDNEKKSSTTTEKGTATSTEAKSDDDIDLEFKEAMDAYEAFMDDYVEFMKKYQANPTDLTLLAEYATIMSDYADYCAEFEDWEDEELNDAELAYYLDVQTRVNKKLMEVAQ